jgi:hypothetical protein
VTKIKREGRISHKFCPETELREMHNGSTLSISKGTSVKKWLKT